MNARRLVVFKHDSHLGNAAAHRLFDRVSIRRFHDGEEYDPRDRRAHDLPAARAFADYRVSLDGEDLPSGVEIIDRI